MVATLTSPTEPTGQVGVRPRLARFSSNDSLADALVAGYISSAVLQGNPLSTGDFVLLDFEGQGAAVLEAVVASDGTITLVSIAATLQGVATPGDFAVFADAEGDLIDLGYEPTNSSLTDVVMVNGAVTAGHVAIFDADGSIADGGAFAFQPKVYNVTAGQAALATAGSVTVIPSSGSKQFQILNVFTNKGGTNFSGGGGDRLGQFTDGTTVYSVVPAASLQTIANAGWGVTAVPYPASVAINTFTAAGAALTFKYSGGTTDYTAGSILLTVVAIEVA